MASGLVNDGAGPSSQPTSSVPDLVLLNLGLCDIHRDAQRFFCKECTLILCADCEWHEHTKHTIISYQEELERVTVENFKLLEEVCTALLSLKQSIDNLDFMSCKIDTRCDQLVDSVKVSTKKLSETVKRREIELLSEVQSVRTYKVQRLRNQKELLSHVISRVSQISKLLERSFDLTPAVDPVVAHYNAAVQMGKLRAYSTDLNPCEDENIFFHSIEQHVCDSLSKFGAIGGSPHPFTINQMIASLSSQPDGSQPIAYPSTSQCHHVTICPTMKVPRSRTIFGTIEDVIVRPFMQVPHLVFGKEGTGDGEICRPWGVCCNALGHIIVADRSNNRVQVFDKNGKFLYKFGKYGSGPGEFYRPAGIAINPFNQIVVVDKDNHRVQVFEMDGRYVFGFGQYGSEDGQFTYPWDVACNLEGTYVVSDSRNHRIQLFTKHGKYIGKFGFMHAALWKHFDSPRGVAFTPNGRIIVTDFNNHRLAVINRDLNKVHFIGKSGMNFGQFQRPQKVVTDDQGNIIVSDSKNCRVQVLSPYGSYITKLGEPGSEPGAFQKTCGLCLSPEGRIIVVDFGGSRIQVY